MPRLCFINLKASSYGKRKNSFEKKAIRADYT